MGKNFFILSKNIQIGSLVSQSLFFDGYWDSYSDCDANYSFLCSAKVKSAIPCDFKTWWVIKHGDNFLYDILIFGIVFSVLN